MGARARVLGAWIVTTGAVGLFGVHALGRGPTARLVDRYRLTGVGIGNLTFGEGPEVVARELQPLLGLPATASVTSRTRSTSLCGFQELFWVGLAARPNGANSDGLTVYFRRRRFAGYSYGPPYGGRLAPRVRNGAMLSTVRGLGLDDPISLGRRLYGGALLLFDRTQGTPPNLRLGRLQAWQVRTSSGLLYGFVDGAGRSQSAIGSISAGATPDTPCP